MDKTFVLKAEVRDNTGSKHTAKVRAAGRIPAIIYGHKQAPSAVSLDAHNFNVGLHHGHRLIDVQLGRKKETTLVKALQYDHLGRDIIHVDLMRVDASETVKIAVPIELKGTAQGTHEGGIIEEHVDSLEVECLVSDIPETIVVSMKDVAVGDAVHAGDVELPEGVKLASAPDLLLVTCHLVAAAKTTEELEEEMPSAPEVIGETEKADEDQGGGEKE
ncbi:MAG: 50S ribosomal protein L25 [Sedimentisphaerales bacterium]|nr:50S ribosomal protein L25 [Sedimentisphaerales bacterium]